MPNESVVRFGLGDPAGWRSASWRVWANPTTPDVYVANRDVGHALKVSLHESGRWHYAFNTDELADALSAEPRNDRFISTWEEDEARLAGTPLRQAFAVVLGRFSLGYPPLPVDKVERSRLAKKLAAVTWVEELPPIGPHGWQFTVFVSDSGTPTTPPATRGMGAVPVGGFDLVNGASVWVMRHPANSQRRHATTSSALPTMPSNALALPLSQPHIAASFTGRSRRVCAG